MSSCVERGTDVTAYLYCFIFGLSVDSHSFGCAALSVVCGRVVSL
jgi:hypothetical protein